MRRILRATFAILVFGCGAGQLLSVIAIWSPFYRLDGLVKLIAAAASVVTAVLLWWLVPRLSVLRNAARLLAADEEKRQTDERFRMLVESAKEYAIFMLDPKGIIKTWNFGAQRLQGYRAEDIIGKHFSCFYSAEDQASGKQDRELKTAILAGQFEEDCWRVRADGSKFKANVVLTPLRDRSGTVIGFSKIIRDITDRMLNEDRILQLNRTLKRRNLQLETANKELEAFSYSVSHDLRAPLRSIDGFSKAVLDDYADKLDAGCREHLNRVRAASQRMGHLIDDLLNLSRVSRGELLHEPTDLSRLAREVVNECQANARDRDVTVQIETGLVTDADPRLMQVVLTNLIGNAWKFTCKNPDARIEFGCRDNDGQLEYFVSDNGAGFDMKYAGKLFGAFQRLHSDHEFPGSGIGLATVQRIIHRHGGDIRAHSAPGQGATLYFTLDQYNGVRGRPAQPVRQAEESTGRTS